MQVIDYIGGMLRPYHLRDGKVLILNWKVGCGGLQRHELAIPTVPRGTCCVNRSTSQRRPISPLFLDGCVGHESRHAFGRPQSLGTPSEMARSVDSVV